MSLAVSPDRLQVIANQGKLVSTQHSCVLGVFSNMAIADNKSGMMTDSNTPSTTKSTPFTAVRKIATLHGYKEIHCNTQTAKIAFEKEEEVQKVVTDDDDSDDDEAKTENPKKKRIRINVYFTTGTVAGMVHMHDEMDGTIQFWTDTRPSKKEMISIFQDPMVSANSTYEEEYFYSLSEWRAGGPSIWSRVFKKSNGTAKEEEEVAGGNDDGSDDDFVIVDDGNSEDDEGNNWSRNDGKECDDARRWKYVQAVTNFCTYDEVMDITYFCEMWNKIRYGLHDHAHDGDEEEEEEKEEIKTSRDAFESLLLPEEEGVLKFCSNDCGICGQDMVGSYCSLGRVLCEAALETDPDTLVPILSYSIGSTDAVDAEAHSMDRIIKCDCPEGNTFVERYGDELNELKETLMSFPEYIRRELIQFYLQKLMHSYTLLVKLDGDGSGDNEDAEKEEVTDASPKYSTYRSYFLQNAIRAAHVDYGELYYDPYVKCQCFCHGCR